MRVTTVVAATLAAPLIFATGLSAQQGMGSMAPPPSAKAPMPAVGDMAPDFTLPAATIKGISARPIQLSSLRGQTVVLAFFPKQRSSGCTIQMKAYRDKYDSVFGGGKAATLLAISTDPVADVASWAQEEKFPFTFVSDSAKIAGPEYGTLGRSGRYENRILFVIAPNGRIAYIMAPFNEVDPTSYDTLAAAIRRAKAMTD